MSFSKKKSTIPKSKKNWYKNLTGAICYLLAYWIVVFCFSRANPVLVSTLRKTGIVFGAIFAAVILKEKFGNSRILFSLLLFVGIILIKL